MTKHTNESPQPDIEGRARESLIRREALEEAAKVAKRLVGTSVPHVVHVPEQDDITSMGTPCREPAYSFSTTRLVNGKDVAAAIRSLAKEDGRP